MFLRTRRRDSSRALALSPGFDSDRRDHVAIDRCTLVGMILGTRARPLHVDETWDAESVESPADKLNKTPRKRHVV